MTNYPAWPKTNYPEWPNPEYRPGAVPVRRPADDHAVPSSSTVEMIASEERIAAADVQYDVFVDREYVGYIVYAYDLIPRPGQEALKNPGWLGSDNLGAKLLRRSNEAAYRLAGAILARNAERATH